MVEVFGVSLAWPVLLKLGAAVLAVVAGSVIAATWAERALAAWARRRGLLPEGTRFFRVRRFVLPVLLTTLGIGSLAVALALQDTLGNFFAGLYLKADRPVRLGDYVRVDTGDEGTVMHIGWRSTRLQTLANNTVVLPNERLSKAVVTNYNLPDPEASVDVRVTVAYDTDLERVERLLAEAARHARADHPGMLDDPPPAVRLIPGFGPKGLDLTLSVWVRDFRDKAGVEDALRRHILVHFRAEAIKIPTT